MAASGHGAPPGKEIGQKITPTEFKMSSGSRRVGGIPPLRRRRPPQGGISSLPSGMVPSSASPHTTGTAQREARAGPSGRHLPGGGERASPLLSPSSGRASPVKWGEADRRGAEQGTAGGGLRGSYQGIWRRPDATSGGREMPRTGKRCRFEGFFFPLILRARTAPGLPSFLSAAINGEGRGLFDLVSRSGLRLPPVEGTPVAPLSLFKPPLT